MVHILNPLSFVCFDFFFPCEIWQSALPFFLKFFNNYHVCQSLILPFLFPSTELATPNTEMVTPRIQRQLIDVPRIVDFPDFCCLGVSQKTSFPVTSRSAFGVACRFRLVQLLHNGKMIKLDQQSPFELKPKMSISAGASESLPVSCWLCWQFKFSSAWGIVFSLKVKPAPSIDFFFFLPSVKHLEGCIIHDRARFTVRCFISGMHKHRLILLVAGLPTIIHRA